MTRRKNFWGPPTVRQRWYGAWRYVRAYFHHRTYGGRISAMCDIAAECYLRRLGIWESGGDIDAAMAKEVSRG